MPEPEFVDTNIFLRYLTNDVPRQAAAVDRLLEMASEGRISLVTSVVVIHEIVWTLESYYDLDRTDIRDHVFAILNTPGLHVQDPDLLLQAASDYADHNVDFADAYNAAWARRNACTTVHTFDKKHFARLGVPLNVPA